MNEGFKLVASAICYGNKSKYFAIYKDVSHSKSLRKETQISEKQLI